MSARLGGVFRVTDGLQAEMGVDRCFDTPVAESGIIGTAIGMAIYGLRPVVEMQFDGFSYPALNQVISHVAKYRNRTRGRVGLPHRHAHPVRRRHRCGGAPLREPRGRTTRTRRGSRSCRRARPPTRTRCCACRSRITDPVIFLEPKRRYWLKEDLDLPVTAPPIGRAVVRRAGTTATVIAYGPMVTTAMDAATAATESGWDLEVIDVRTLSPLDIDTLTESVTKTGRALVVHEAARFGGFGAEIAAEVTERAFGYLAAPVLRVTGWDVPVPAGQDRAALPPRPPTASSTPSRGCSSTDRCRACATSSCPTSARG